MKSSNRSVVPIPFAKIKFFSYLVQDSQNEMLNFYFKSGFSTNLVNSKSVLHTIEVILIV